VKLTYPADFPQASCAKIDLGIEEAELCFSNTRSGPSRFVRQCFFAFVTEECSLAMQKGWTVGRIDQDAERAFDQIVKDGLQKYCRHVSNSMNKYEFNESARREIERSEDYEVYRRSRKAVAEAIASGVLQVVSDAETGWEPFLESLRESMKSAGEVLASSRKTLSKVDFESKFTGSSYSPAETGISLKETPPASVDSIGSANETIPIPAIVKPPESARIKGERRWEEVKIEFISDERVQIFIGDKKETLNYAEFGFCDARNQIPDKQWETLRSLAESHGILASWDQRGEKYIQAIRKVLRRHFEISEDPIPLIPSVGYKTRFEIARSKAFET
jgi:hypothetical protein